jgi:hypothetical protein
MEQRQFSSLFVLKVWQSPRVLIGVIRMLGKKDLSSKSFQELLTGAILKI